MCSYRSYECVVILHTYCFKNIALFEFKLFFAKFAFDLQFQQIPQLSNLPMTGW